MAKINSFVITSVDSTHLINIDNKTSLRLLSFGDSRCNIDVYDRKMCINPGNFTCRFALFYMTFKMCDFHVNHKYSSLDSSISNCGDIGLLKSRYILDKLVVANKIKSCDKFISDHIVAISLHRILPKVYKTPTTLLLTMPKIPTGHLDYKGIRVDLHHTFNVYELLA